MGPDFVANSMENGQGGMKQTVLSLGLVALLAACGGSTGNNPVSGGDVVDGAFGIPADDTPLVGVPDNIAMNINVLNFDAASGTLTIAIDGLDAGTPSTSYARTTALDVNGYAAFVRQDDPLDRFFLALADASPDGSVQSASVTDGGQFNTFFGGAQFIRIGTYSQPTSGLFSYAGEYAGSLNGGERVDTLALPAGFPATGSGLAPNQPYRVTGSVFLNVDFADNQLNGEIFNRELLSSSTAAGGDDVVIRTLENMVLIPTDIEADGTFAGSIEFPETRQNAGDFAGTFGGSQASSVAVGVHLDNLDQILENEEEYGNFSLAKCGTAGASSLCSGVGG